MAIKDENLFDIHMSVHRNVITNYSQQDPTFLEFIYFYRRSTCYCHRQDEGIWFRWDSSLKSKNNYK